MDLRTLQSRFERPKSFTQTPKVFHAFVSAFAFINVTFSHTLYEFHRI